MNLKSIGNAVVKGTKKTGSVVVNTDLADIGKGIAVASVATVHGVTTASKATGSAVSNKVHSGRKAARDLRTKRVAASKAKNDLAECDHDNDVCTT